MRALEDGNWNVDPARSELSFAVKDMWGLRTVRGVFGAYHGKLTVRAGNASGELAIEADSVDTDDRRRDRHLRSPAFFDVEHHPRLLFTALALSAHDGRLMVTGELTIGSSRQRLDIPATAERGADGALRLEAKTTVSRPAAGMTWNKLGMIRGDVALHARLTLTREAGSGMP